MTLNLITILFFALQVHFTFKIASNLFGHVTSHATLITAELSETRQLFLQLNHLRKKLFEGTSDGLLNTFSQALVL